MIKQENLIDGKRYIVHFRLDNGELDSVSAIWVAVHKVFSHSIGSISYSEAVNIE